MMKNIKLNFKLLCRGIILVFPIVLILFISMVFQEKIVIKSIYPEKSIASVPFNSFNGEAALSLKGTGFKKGDIIYVDDNPQKTTFGSSDLLTCIVEKELYGEPTKLKIKVVRKDGEKIILKSNTKYLEIVSN